jgi:hypothetical protein
LLIIFQYCFNAGFNLHFYYLFFIFYQLFKVSGNNIYFQVNTIACV